MPNARTTSTAVLVLLTASAAVLRFRGLDDLLPHVINRDGMVHVRQAEHFRGYAGDPEADRMLALNPQLYSRIAALWPLPAAEPGQAPGRKLSLEEALDESRAPWLRLRWVSSIFSLILIPGTYLLARRFLGRPGSLFAAGLVATCFLHILASVQEKAHATTVSFLLLALLAALRLRRKADVGSYFLFAIAAALAVGTMHNGFICLLAAAVAWALRDREPRHASPAWILVPVAAVVGAILAFWPFVWEIGSQRLAMPGTGLTPLASFLRVLTPEVYRSDQSAVLLPELWRHDPFLVVMAAIGALAWIAGGLRSPARFRGLLHGDGAVLVAFAAPYCVFLLFFVSSTARYVLALLPVMACAGGYAFSLGPGKWTALLRGPGIREAVLLAAGGGILALPVAMAWRYAEIRTRPDTLEEAAGWLEENVASGERIVVVPTFDLPLLPTEEALTETLRDPWKSAWAQSLSRGLAERVDAPRFGVLVQPGPFQEGRAELLRDPGAYFRRWGAKYVVLATPKSNRVHAPALAWLSREARRELRLSPLRVDDGRDEHVLFENDPGDPSVWILPETRALGPTVEIYRMP